MEYEFSLAYWERMAELVEYSNIALTFATNHSSVFGNDL